MLNRLIRRRLDAFERDFKCDVSHMREVLAASRRAFQRLARVQAMDAYRQDVPVGPWYAAKLVATLHEDCGPCTQLVADMALRDGVPPPVVRAVVAGREEAMGPEVLVGYRFARAVLAHHDSAGELRAEVSRRWGPRGLVSLAFGITTSRMYPTLKYALGHGHACRVVRIGDHGEPVTVRPAA